MGIGGTENFEPPAGDEGFLTDGTDASLEPQEQGSTQSDVNVSESFPAGSLEVTWPPLTPVHLDSLVRKYADEATQASTHHQEEQGEQ